MKHSEKDNLWKEIKVKKKTTVKSAVTSFLEFVFDFADNLGNTAMQGKHVQPFGDQYTPKQFHQLISQCKRTGYIEIKKNNNQQSIVLTNKAHLKIIEKIAGTKQKDSRFRFVSYDIPEKFKTSRDKFRRAIKKMGFVQIQKSLWVCNRNVGELIELAAYEYKVENYIVYIISEKSDIDGLIEKKLIDNKSPISK